MKGMICSLCGSPLEMDGRSRVKPCTGCIAELKIQSITLKDENFLIVKSELFTSEDLEEYVKVLRKLLEDGPKDLPIIVVDHEIDIKSFSDEELKSVGLQRAE